MKQIVARYAVLGAGVALMFVGGLVLALRSESAVSFGWSAYVPLRRGPILPDLSQPVGLILVTLGFAAAVSWIGFQIGRSAASVPSVAAPADPADLADEADPADDAR